MEDSSVIALMSLDEFFANDALVIASLVLLFLFVAFLIVMRLTRNSRKRRRQNKMKVVDNVPKIKESTTVIEDAEEDEVKETTTVIKASKAKEIVPDIEESETVIDAEPVNEVSPDIEESLIVIQSETLKSVVTSDGDYYENVEGAVIDDIIDYDSDMETAVSEVTETDSILIVKVPKRPSRLRKSIGRVEEDSEKITVTMYKKEKRVYFS